MSLFKAREWWTTACGTDETFDIGCMLVASVGSEKQTDHRIVVGSHEVRYDSTELKIVWDIRSAGSSDSGVCCQSLWHNDISG